MNNSFFYGKKDYHISTPPPRRRKYDELFTAIEQLAGRALTEAEKTMLKMLADYG